MFGYLVTTNGLSLSVFCPVSSGGGAILIFLNLQPPSFLSNLHKSPEAMVRLEPTARLLAGSTFNVSEYMTVGLMRID